jgi:hypothetical protein
VKKSAGTGNGLIASPTSGLNFLSYKLKKDDFRSLNGILRISKDPSSYFSNFKIQDPDNELKLLNSNSPLSTIYSFNNLVIKSGSKFYTWGNNDSSCNGINPNEVYNRIDNYSNVGGSREDTMTICLSESGKLTDTHDLDNDLYIIIPIKPTKGLNKYSPDGTTESENSSNRVIAGQN